MLEPYIFIVLLNYNGAEDTLACIESIRRQEYSNRKVVVVDNHSSDDSLSVLSEGPDDSVVLLPQERNLGFSGGNNVGLEYALSHGAEYIMFLNNDTLLEDGCLERMAAQMKPDTVLCPRIMFDYDREIVWYAGGRLNRREGHFESNGYGKHLGPEYLKEGETELASGCCLMMSTETIEKLGKWSEEYFLYREDDDYSLRMKQAGMAIRYIPDAVVYHKESASSIRSGSSVRNYYMTRNSFYLVRKFGLGLPARLYLWTGMIAKGLLRRDRIYLEAYRDYRKGRMGRSERV